MMNVLSCLAVFFIGLFNLDLFGFFFKMLFCRTKPFLPARLTCIKYISFRKMLRSASYALYSPFPVGKEKKHLIIYCFPNSLKINVCRHFVPLSIYMLNTVDNDGKHVS